uniref:Uncharacterized protein n=1 Tax=viral metagenome TaxID=1070528 RepID=A0A6M3JNF5_9ZZZZ
MQIMVKGQIYHCRFCHKDYRYRGMTTGCGQDCCHGADEQLTPNESFKEFEKQQQRFKIK